MFNLEPKQISSILCIGATSASDLSNHYNEEDTEKICSDFIRITGEIIHKYGGIIYQRLDNDLTIIFQNTKDQTERHAQLAYLSAADIFKALSGIVNFHVRFSIDSGELLIKKESNAKNYTTVIGHAINFSRFLNEDLYDDVLAITETSVRLMEFKPSSIKRSSTKKFKDQQKIVYYVSDFQIENETKIKPATTYAGRTAELKTLLGSYNKVLSSGISQGLFVHGPAGIGKTRLLEEFLKHIRNKGAIVEYKFYSNDNDGYQTLKDILGRILIVLGIDNFIPSRNLINYIKHYFPLTHEAAVPALEKIILGLDSHPFWEGLNTRTQAYLCAGVVAEIASYAARNFPFVFIIEDIHWAPQIVNILVEECLEKGQDNILLLVTSRNDPAVDTYQDQMEAVKLHNLTAHDIQLIAKDVFSNSEDIKRITSALLDKSEGNPFYLTEIIDFIAADKNTSVTNGKLVLGIKIEQIGLPIGLRNLIQKRISLLPQDAQHTIALLGIAGQKIDKRLIDAISYGENSNIIPIIDDLCKEGLIFSKLEGLDSYYIFRHSLIQISIYESISDLKRRDIHSYLLSKMEADVVLQSDRNLSALAYHAYAAGSHNKSYNYNYKLGQRSFTQYNHNKSLEALHRCLGNIEQVKQSEKKRNNRKGRILNIISKNFFFMADFPTMRSNLRKIEPLFAEGLFSSTAYSIAQTRASYHWIVGLYDKALLDLEQCLQSPHASKVTCFIKLAGIHSDMGDFSASNKYLDKAQALIEDPNHRETYEVAFPPLGGSRSLRARNYAAMGNKIGAETEIREALRIAEMQTSPPSRIYIYSFCAHAYLDLGRYDEAYSLIKEARNLSETYRVDLLLSYIDSLMGFIQIKRGDNTGLELLKQAVSMGTKEHRLCRLSLYYLHLAEALGHLGQKDESIEACEMAIELSYQQQEKFVHAKAMLNLLETHLEDPSLRKNKIQCDMLIQELNRLIREAKLQPLKAKLERLQGAYLGIYT